jgi:hypothetical protein
MAPFSWGVGKGRRHRTTTALARTWRGARGYSLADYAEKWSNPFGLLEMDPSVRADTRSFEGKRFNISAAPFKVGADFSVFDHLKYIGTSNRSFPVPAAGSVQFASTITAATPGTVPNLTQQGVFGPPSSWTDPLAPPSGFDAYEAPVLQGQQAGVVMSMVDFCTGQLFDWFVAGDTAFALIERLPSNVTGNTSNPGCPGARHVGRELMYTQIVKELPVTPGEPHKVAIRYARKRSGAFVDYFLDGRRVSRVENVGIPLDVQGVPYTGIYPSLGHGELVDSQIGSFTIGHGAVQPPRRVPVPAPGVARAERLDSRRHGVTVRRGTCAPVRSGRDRVVRRLRRDDGDGLSGDQRQLLRAREGLDPGFLPPRSGAVGQRLRPRELDRQPAARVAARAAGAVRGEPLLQVDGPAAVQRPVDAPQHVDPGHARGLYVSHSVT